MSKTISDDLKNKKLLILGGKPIGSREIVELAEKNGVYTIVADYLPSEQSPAKMIADEAWDVSTADIGKLAELVAQNNVDGVYSGVHEFNIKKMIELCEKLDLPCFCTEKQWDMLNNKKIFKSLCSDYGIPVTKQYTDINDDSIRYPVIIKPSDGSGSRGFSICRNKNELVSAYKKSVDFSFGGGVLIEKYMNYENSVIINYTVIDGRVFYCGMSDKKSKKVFDDGAPIMSMQFYPARYEEKYLKELDEKARNMFEGIGLRNGVIWIEAFCDEGGFTFNEMGFRFGGSLTYLPVRYFYGVDQLELQIHYALTGGYPDNIEFSRRNSDRTYCIFPVHVREGLISDIEGLDELKSMDEIVEIVPVHFLGDVIEKWGSAQQVFAYIHYTASGRDEADEFARVIMEKLKVRGENGEQLLFNLYTE